ncbi:MAG: MBL fold metallo-hydrolase [Candidatus Hodarchaeota archaeon]
MKTSIAPHIRNKAKTHSIHQLKMGFSFIYNFTYIIVDTFTKEAAIVDPAWDLETINDKLCMLDVHLTTVLLTHSHFDHVNLVEPLIRRFDSQVYMSLKEIEFYKFQCKNLNPVQHYDIIQLGKTRIAALLTPGHTAGSTSFLLSDSLFTGDFIFIEGCGICHTVGGCPEKMFDSIQMIKETVASDVCVYPGHSFGNKPGYPIEYLMKENIYFLINEKELFINFRMRKNQNNILNFR